MEDDLKILKVEYLSNHWSDLPQILNLSLGDQTQKCLKLRPHPMEDDLKILKIEYISNHCLFLPHFFNLSSGDQTKIKNAWHEEDLQWKTTSKY